MKIAVPARAQWLLAVAALLAAYACGGGSAAHTPNTQVLSGTITIDRSSARIGDTVSIHGEGWPNERISLCVYVYEAGSTPPSFVRLYTDRRYATLAAIAVPEASFDQAYNLTADLKYEDGSLAHIGAGTTIVFFTKEPHGAHTGPTLSVLGS